MQRLAVSALGAGAAPAGAKLAVTRIITARTLVFTLSVL
jgi:hypothetical protein